MPAHPTGTLSYLFEMLTLQINVHKDSCYLCIGIEWGKIVALGGIQACATIMQLVEKVHIT